jgi:hypothetical protein
MQGCTAVNNNNSNNKKLQNNIWWRVRITNLLVKHCVHHHLAYLLVGSNIFFSTVFLFNLRPVFLLHEPELLTAVIMTNICYVHKLWPLHSLELYLQSFVLLITVAAWSKARNVFARTNPVVGGSNLTRGMDVCVFVFLFYVCVVLHVGRGLVVGWSPVQGVLPTVCRIKKLKKRLRPNKRL